jgi:cation diffusion facilitator CzcD-associated flavoprotein CzcO
MSAGPGILLSAAGPRDWGAHRLRSPLLEHVLTDPPLAPPDASAAPRHVNVAIVGSGFSGLGMAIRLKQEGIEDFEVLERADELGGTWRDNTYPGCACDIPSHLYSFSFAPNPDWSRTYSPQPEIWSYLSRCAEQFGITPHLRFGHEVLSATWDEETARYHVETTAGPLTARVLVAGPGPLSEPSTPAIPGLATFEGTLFHSAAWDHTHDLTGERVAVIGTGASAIQFVPRIQPRVERMTVFQRTAPWIVGLPQRGISQGKRRLYRGRPLVQRIVRGTIYASREVLLLGLAKRRMLAKPTEALARRHLRKHIADPALRARLTPEYRIGCKRILVSNDYYPALEQPNVEVVTEGIREVRPTSLVTVSGAEHHVDTIIYGTGFRPMELPLAEHLRGRDGVVLEDRWRGAPRAHLGTTVAGFPNFFLLIGPNTGLGHNSMVYMIESQIAYVLDCLRTMADRGLALVEVREEAQAEYNRDVQEQMKGTVWIEGGCASWYLDADGVNRTLWPSFTFAFRRRTRRFDVESYRVETRAPDRAPALA